MSRGDAAPAPSFPPPPAAAQAESRAERRRGTALAALGGVLYVVAFPGIDQWYLALFAFVPVLYATRRAGVRRAAWLGAVAGFVSHLGGYYWVVHLLHEFAFAPYVAAVPGWLALCVWQGASFGFGVGLSRWLELRTGWPRAVTLAVGLAAMDFVYPLLFPSYVANTMGGALWLMQTADLWGVLGVTAMLGALNGALADLLVAWREGRALPRRAPAAVAALWVAAIAYGAIQVHRYDAKAAAAPKLRVGLVQANVGGQAKHEHASEVRRRHVQATRELAARGVDLVVWPEGAWPGMIDAHMNVRDLVLEGTPQALLFGATRMGGETGEVLPYNSAFLAEASGRILGHYDKIELLAFGEYVPGDRFFPQIYRLLPYSSHFGRGQTTAPLPLGDWKLGTFICYEDIIPSLVQRVMAARGGVRPDAMVNLTNDSWYGDTTEPPIHLSLARYRSVEHRRALARATNTGISAFVDPSGRLVAATRTYRQETLVGELPKMSGSTVYETVGDAVGWASLAVLALGAAIGRFPTRSGKRSRS